MNRKFLPKNQSGFSLVELLLGFAVVAVLLIIMLGNYSQANNKTTVEREKNRLLTLKRAITDSYGGRSTYTGINNLQILAGSTIPNEMRAGAGELQNAWADAGYVITPSGGGDTFTITSAAVPDNFCYDIVVATDPTIMGFEQVSVNGNVIANPADAQAQCNAGANALAWIGRR